MTTSSPARPGRGALGLCLRYRRQTEAAYVQPARRQGPVERMAPASCSWDGGRSALRSSLIEELQHHGKAVKIRASPAAKGGRRSTSSNGWTASSPPRTSSPPARSCGSTPRAAASMRSPISARSGRRRRRTSGRTRRQTQKCLQRLSPYAAEEERTLTRSRRLKRLARDLRRALPRRQTVSAMRMTAPPVCPRSQLSGSSELGSKQSKNRISTRTSWLEEGPRTLAVNPLLEQGPRGAALSRKAERRHRSYGSRREAQIAVRTSGGVRPTGSGPSITRPSTKRSGTLTAGLPSSVVRFPIASRPIRMLGPAFLRAMLPSPGSSLSSLSMVEPTRPFETMRLEVELLEHVLQVDHRHHQLTVEIAALR